MSPDQRWVAFNSNESGRHQVFVVPFPPTGERWQVSVNGGVQPTWRRDGGELYFLALDGTIMAAPVRRGPKFTAGEPVPLFKTTVTAVSTSIEQYAPAPDGSRFLFLDHVGTDRDLSLTVVTNWRALLNENRRR